MEDRLRRCKLEAHPEKTRIVHCREGRRTENYEPVSFDFLGYRFQPRPCKSRTGHLFIGYNPAMSVRARKKVLDKVRSWGLQRMSDRSLGELALLVNPSVRGWLNYYGRYYKDEMKHVFQPLNAVLVRWARWKYQKVRNGVGRAWAWMRRIAVAQPGLFAHWVAGFTP